MQKVALIYLAEPMELADYLFLALAGLAIFGLMTRWRLLTRWADAAFISTGSGLIRVKRGAQAYSKKTAGRMRAQADR